MPKLYAVYFQYQENNLLPLVIKRDFQAACEFARTYYMALNPDQPFSEQVVQGNYFGIGEANTHLRQLWALTVNIRDAQGVDLSKEPLFVHHGDSKTTPATFVFGNLIQASKMKQNYPDLRLSTYQVDFIDHERMLLEQAWGISVE